MAATSVSVTALHSLLQCHGRCVVANQISSSEYAGSKGQQPFVIKLWEVHRLSVHADRLSR